jgi:hypothetical protein
MTFPHLSLSAIDGNESNKRVLYITVSNENVFQQMAPF